MSGVGARLRALAEEAAAAAKACEVELEAMTPEAREAAIAAWARGLAADADLND